MRNVIHLFLWSPCLLLAILALCASGCKKADTDTDPGTGVAKPKQAASHLEQAFAGADAETKNAAAMASEALRSADFEKAVVSLDALKSRQNLTLPQGKAVHEAELALEARLIAAMDAGDPKAKQAFELRKVRRRN